jgi:riboflavin synthase
MCASPAFSTAAGDDMFTGIVETLGTVDSIESTDTSSRLVVRAPILDDVAVGDSIAVNGVCLTATDVTKESFAADVMAETLRRTALASLQTGDSVNLERAATPSTRLGGHLVQGHVDGVGRLTRRAPAGEFDEVGIALPDALLPYVVEKGSIAIDGISLTVASVKGDEVTIGLIPETLQRTTLGRRAVGDEVNIEVDVIAKYVERLIESRLEQR